tara:strand:+ start:464 stop:1150 length:687 start_codon:yes stop_codon:yes gene_type:complete
MQEREIEFKGFTKDIEVIDNIIPSQLADNFESRIIDKNFPWYLIRDIQDYKLNDNQLTHRVVNDENTVNTLQLGHGVYNCEDVGAEINSGVYAETKAICDYCCQKFQIRPQYLKQKLNLLGNNSLLTEGKYNTPHIDNQYFNSYSIIYYVNDSDGDTIIFNETSDEKTKKRPEKLTIKKRITPKKGRAVLFKGDYFHTSTNPTNYDKRVVLNVNCTDLNEIGYKDDTK